MGKRRVSTDQLDYLIIGSTIPWHWKFWNAPLVASCLGHRVPGFHMEQACATGLQATVLAASEVEGGAYDVVGVLTFDRTSDSPVGVFPERRAYERTMALSDVWDNFGFDPATGKAMITTAGLAARKYKLDRREIDEITLSRYEDYFEANMRAARAVAWYFPTVAFLRTIGISMVLLLGGRRVLSGDLTFGSLVVFLLYLDWFFQPIINLSNTYNQLQSSAAAFRKPSWGISTTWRDREAAVTVVRSRSSTETVPLSGS